MSKSKNRKVSHATPKASGRTGRQTLDKNNNNPSRRKESKKSKDYEKYSLRPRSIQNRIETEKRQKGEVKKEPKPKHKPPPLSKYRRKTANARERGRMREINTAYELLQQAVPTYPVLPTNAQGKTCEKLTKITTLRVAMNYIESLKLLLNQPGASSSSTSGSVGALSCNDIDSDSESLGNSIVSGSSCSNSIGSLGSGSEFSPASSYTMSPMSSCSPVGPDCIQTVMRSVVSPAAAAAISANAATFNNLNNVSLSSLTSSPGSLGMAPHQSITTIVTIPSHPHAQAQYSRQLPPTVHHHQQQQTSQFQHINLPPPRPPPVITPNFITPSAHSFDPHHQLNLHPKQHHHQVHPHFQNSTIPQNPLLCSSPSASLVNQCMGTSGKTKLPPIATTLSSALLRKSMSSFLSDCIQLTNGMSVSNNNGRTGSLSSLTESDLSEYTNDLLSDEGSVLDEPMFEDIIGVGTTDLDLFLGTDSEHLVFSTDLSAL